MAPGISSNRPQAIGVNRRTERQAVQNYPSQEILGIKFFNGDVDEAVAFMFCHGGFLVAPSGTCFTPLREDELYRRAMLTADLVIADSGLMLVMWRLFRGEKLTRISGLKYLKEVLAKLRGEGIPKFFWILPSEGALQKLLDWSCRGAFAVKIDDCHIAPHYGLEIEDRRLIALASA